MSKGRSICTFVEISIQNTLLFMGSYVPSLFHERTFSQSTFPSLARGTGKVPLLINSSKKKNMRKQSKTTTTKYTKIVYLLTLRLMYLVNMESIHLTFS